MRKNKSKQTSAAKRARTVVVAKIERTAPAERTVTPLRDRRLSFGHKWDYAPAPESFDYIKIPARHDLFIDGKFVAPHSSKYFESLNPATEDKLSEIAVADHVDVDLA